MDGGISASGKESTEVVAGMGQESFDWGIGASGKESTEVVAAQALAVACSAALYGIQLVSCGDNLYIVGGVHLCTSLPSFTFIHFLLALWSVWY